MLQYGETALHKAASSSRSEIIKLLIDYHAAVNVTSEVWYTCTMNEVDKNGRCWPYCEMKYKRTTIIVRYIKLHVVMS